MIFYTLKGPSHSLEIHDDKILLKKRTWLRLFSTKAPAKVWTMEGLAQFNITIPQYLLWGKVEWRSFDGNYGTFRFSTNPIMMKKIELYLQKKIIKNHQKVLGTDDAPKKERLALAKSSVQAAA